jgi:CII-binding regulator of phage lambda lysogenization HflD
LPFWVVYGRGPPSLHQFVPGEAVLLAVQTQMASQDEFLAEIKERLEQAQQQYKKFYDTKHHEVEDSIIF